MVWQPSQKCNDGTDMAGIDGVNTSAQQGLRPPKQERTHRQWMRILDAGVELLEEGGYGAFTIPALCERAAVPPRALYARADSKEVLFLAVYDHAMARIDRSEAALDAGTEGLSPREMVTRAVRALTDVFLTHRAFLRAVVLASATHVELARRGEERRRALLERFVAALEPLDDGSPHADPRAAREVAFAMVFSALVVRSTYGESFAGPAAEPTTLVDTVWRYLCAATPD